MGARLIAASIPRCDSRVKIRWGIKDLQVELISVRARSARTPWRGSSRGRRVAQGKCDASRRERLAADAGLSHAIPVTRGFRPVQGALGVGPRRFPNSLVASTGWQARVTMSG